MKQPGQAEQFGVTTLNTVVLEYKGRREKVNGDGEQELTNGLIKVIQGRQPKVYFTQGHGEKDTVSADRAGYNGLATNLTSGNFIVEKLVLAQASKVPDEADILVIAGPKADFLAPEIDALKAYLARGGKLLVLLDPVLKADQLQPAALQGLLKDWGIQVGNNIVVDVSGMGQLFGTDDRSRWRELSPSITELQPDDGLPAVALISPVEGGVNSHTAQRLVETSRNSWRPISRA